LDDVITALGDVVIVIFVTALSATVSQSSMVTALSSAEGEAIISKFGQLSWFHSLWLSTWAFVKQCCSPLPPC